MNAVGTPFAKEAYRLGKTAVEEGLAACANVLPDMRSVYRWHGKVEEASEAVLILKSTEAQSDALTHRIRALHGAELPCVVVLPIISGNPHYLDWIAAETHHHHS